jgi:hypothetical protein
MRGITQRKEKEANRRGFTVSSDTPGRLDRHAEAGGEGRVLGVRGLHRLGLKGDEADQAFAGLEMRPNAHSQEHADGNP